MSRTFALCALCLVLTASAAHAQEFGTYHALVIGNNDYQTHPKLRTAVKDARDVAKVLEEDYGYEVTLLENTSFMQLRGALWKYRKSLTAKDNLLIYYAGHGYLDADTREGYWLPVDADATPTTWVSNSTITTALKAISAKHVLVVSDSCYSGSLTRGLTVKLRGEGYYTKMATKRARVVLTSGGLEPVNDEGSGGNSVFAAQFLGALRRNDGVMDGTTLIGRIKRPIMLAADQEPHYGDIRKCGHEGGDFLFVRQAAAEGAGSAEELESLEQRLAKLEVEKLEREKQEKRAGKKKEQAERERRRREELLKQIARLEEQRKAEAAQPEPRAEAPRPDEEPLPDPKAPLVRLRILTPSEDQVSSSADVFVSGRVQPPAAGEVRIGDRKAALLPSGRFALRVPLALGPNRLKIEVSLSDGATIAAERAVTRREVRFRFLREETFASGSKKHTVKIYRFEPFAEALGLSETDTDPACEFVLIPAGRFQMGDEYGDLDEVPVQEVNIRPFLLARTEVTQKVWKGMIGDPDPTWIERFRLGREVIGRTIHDPAKFKAPRNPVERITWGDVGQFLEKAGLRLPCEAEWEYACRGGSTTSFGHGDKTDALHRYAWFRSNAEGETHEIAQLKANGFGLYDMHGNVSEWTQDGYEPTLGPLFARGRAVERDVQRRVIRGGSFVRSGEECRSASRDPVRPTFRSETTGFRPCASFEEGR